VRAQAGLESLLSNLGAHRSGYDVGSLVLVRMDVQVRSRRAWGSQVSPNITLPPGAIEPSASTPTAEIPCWTLETDRSRSLSPFGVREFILPLTTRAGVFGPYGART
jgi:hypothetical protein